MKNNAPKSGFFSIRILLAGTLCLLAALLGAVSLPAPGGQGGVVLASSNAAPSQIGATSTSMPCPGPAICGQSCSLDPNGVPIYCSNGQCQCAPGYDLQNGVCQPIQPEVIGSENVKHIGGYDCPGICPGAENTTWAFVGSIYNAFDLIPVHGTAPGGEAFMPVWGYQANNCGDHGVAMGASCAGGRNNGMPCSSNSDCPGGACTPLQTWAGCAPDPFPFCYGIQGSSPDDFHFDSCDNSAGVGTCGTDFLSCDLSGCPLYCEEGQNEYLPHHSIAPDMRSSVGLCDLCGASTSDFTSAWPYTDESFTCNFHINGFDNPARIDFPNNVIVYRAPIRWEDTMSGQFTSIIDDDWTWDMESQRHELFDTDGPGYLYHSGCSDETHGRIHVEFSSGEVTDNFTDDDWGPANHFWRVMRCKVDSDFAEDSDFCNGGAAGDNIGSCYLKSLVNPELTCPPSETVDDNCNWHDNMAVVVGVPSIDCADNPYQGTDEIHPILAMAIQIQESTPQNPQPEKWAFFYRQHGSTGPCGGANYSRCLSNFKLPLGLPSVPGNAVLTGADVHVEWHKWADETFGSGSDDISVCGSTSDSNGAGSIDCSNSFDLINGAVLDIHLPHNEDGVVGLVTVTPHYDTTPPTITCPGNITTPVDLGKCTATVAFQPPIASDNCSVSVECSIPSGSSFPSGTTTDTCTATDQAGHTSSCSFNVTVTHGNKCPVGGAGYWKNHTGLWPVNSLTLGNMVYTKAQLINILNRPTMGDASLILAQSEIAALLNLANGSNPIPICDTIADADAALDGCTVPCKVGPKTVLGQRMVSDGNRLDLYNLGKLTTGCTP